MKSKSTSLRGAIPTRTRTTTGPEASGAGPCPTRAERRLRWLALFVLTLTTVEAVPRAQCAATGRVERVGAGTHGRSGTPELVHVGLPLEGETFRLELRGGMPGARGIAFLGLGESPQLVPGLGVTFYPAPPWTLVFFTLDVAGVSTPLMELPLVPSLCGLEVVAQARVFDRTGKGGMTFTPATRVRFGGAPSGPLFAMPSFLVGDRPRSLTVADYGGDGVPDLLVASTSATQRSCYGGTLARKKGRGDGSFADGGTGWCFVPWRVFASTTTDLNGDGKIDLLVSGESVVHVGLGRGDGTFDWSEKSLKTFRTMTPIVSVVAGDFNHDGAPDVAALNELESLVHVLFGNGDGSLRRGALYSVGSEPYQLALGDVDGNGFLDLVTSNSGSDDVSVLLGTAFFGTFRSERRFPVGRKPQALVVHDLDGDGVLDVATTNLASDDVSLLVGRGDGGFEAIRSLAAPSKPRGLAVGDMNLDGITDLVVGSLLDELAVLPGLGDATFGPPVVTTAFTAQAVAVGVADFDQDGTPDVAVAHANDASVPSGEGGNLSVLFGNGDGTLRTFELISLGTVLDRPELGDLDGDGALDLVYLAGNGEVSVSLSLGDGRFDTPRTLAVGGDPVDLEVGDFDRDGNLDAAIVDADGARVVVALGDGEGTLSRETSVDVAPAPTFLRKRDIDADGAFDLVVAHEGDVVVVLLGTGKGGFREAQRLALPVPATGIDFMDIDRDGALDLLVTSDESLDGSRYTFSLVYWFAGRGDGTFWGARSETKYYGLGGAQLAVLDANEDGYEDLLVLMRGSPPYYAGPAYLTYSRGHPGPWTVYPPYWQPRAVGWWMQRRAKSFVLGDVNGDGRVDVVVEHIAHADVSLLINNGSAYPFPKPDTTPYFPYDLHGPFPGNFASAGGPLGLGDLDNDGDLDLFRSVPGGLALLRNRRLD